VDLIVHMARFADGSRRIASISQVLGVSPEGFRIEELFAFQMDGFSEEGQLRGECQYTGARPKFLSKFRLNNVEVPSWLNG
jgi:pilus assembly protein CpaF